MKRRLPLFAVFVAAFGFAAEADAQWGFQGYPNFYGRNVYTVYDQDRLPYFSLHPPVYYSQPVPRTYGYSPFAYPGFYPTPDVPTAESEIIVNPYFHDSPQKAPANEAAPAPATPKPMSKLNAPALKGKLPKTPAAKTPSSDKSAAANREVQPLRITNPYAERFLTTAGR